jgi:hypothetical protein
MLCDVQNAKIIARSEWMAATIERCFRRQKSHRLLGAIPGASCAIVVETTQPLLRIAAAALAWSWFDDPTQLGDFAGHEY